VPVIEKHTLDEASTITLMKHKHRYVTLSRNIRMDGANTVAIMFTTVVYSCDEFLADRFIKCMGKLEAAKDQWLFGQQTPEGGASHNVREQLTEVSKSFFVLGYIQLYPVSV